MIFFLNISATKYFSESILYLKLTGGYHLSPHIKTVAAAFYKLSNKATKMLHYENFQKCAVTKDFSEILQT